MAGGALLTPLGRFAAPGLAEGQAAVAFFRPQALALCDPSEGAAARIERAEFLGAQERLVLRLEAGGAELRLDLPSARHPQRPQRVGLRLDPGAVQVFAVAPGDAF